MSGPLPLSLTGAPITTAADPNGTAPGSLTTWTTPPHAGSGDDATAVELELVDGTSATVELWVWVQGTEWALEGTVTLAAVHQVSTPVGAFGGDAIIYPRVTAAAGGPTTIRAGFTRPLPGATTATVAGSVAVSSSALPTGAATSAKQDTTNTALGPIAGAANTPAAITATASAVQLPSNACTKGFWCQNSLGSLTNIRIGDANITTTRGFELAPGDARWCDADNTNRYYAIAVSGSPTFNLDIR